MKPSGRDTEQEVALSAKQARLVEILSGFENLAVALSGGVDSALLLAEARDVLGDRVMAVTARSPIHPDAELSDAIRLASELGVPHRIVESLEWRLDDFLANPPERCYICKRHVFGQLSALIGEMGFTRLAHGANADDRGDYRPGLKAAAELGVAAPLMAAGFSKADIRRVAKARGLFVWNKPAMACLATRFPYHTPITPRKLDQVRQAERFLTEAGFSGLRVRHHGDVARIEIPLAQMPRMVDDPLRSTLVDHFRRLGFEHVCVDLEGYVSGSLNRTIDSQDVPPRPVDG